MRTDPYKPLQSDPHVSVGPSLPRKLVGVGQVFAFQRLSAVLPPGLVSDHERPGQR